MWWTWRKAVAILLVAGCSLYVGWPLWSGWRLREAVRTRDVTALGQRVDWPRLRANLKDRLQDAVEDSATASGPIGGALKRAVGGAVSGAAVDMMVTPATLGRLLAGRAFALQHFPSLGKAGASAATAATGGDDEDVDDPMPPRRLRWAFFESPTRFRIEATNPRLPGARIAAILQLADWAWKLSDVQIVQK